LGKADVIDSPSERTSPSPRLRFRLAPDPAHLLRARERLREYLSGCCADARAVDDLVLAVEEACTNAIRHSGSPGEIEIALDFDAGHATATVKDTGRGFDVAAFDPERPPDPSLDHGRGLFLISRLCDDVVLSCDGGLEVRLVKRDVVAAPGAAAPDVAAPGAIPAFDPTGQRSFLEEIDELFAALDWEFRYLYVNRRFCEMTGMGRAELLGHTLWDLFPELVGTEVERRLLDAMHLGIASRYEFCLPALGGWFEQRLYPTAHGINQFSIEIGERKRSEAEREALLERSQAQTREPKTQSTTLRAQGEEVLAQSEALRAQDEDVQLQADELRAQTEELAERVRLSEALNAINRLVHATFTTDQILQRALNEGVRATRLDAGAIEVRAPAGGWLVRCQYGLDPAATGAVLPDEIATDATRAEATRDLVAVADLHGTAADVGFVHDRGLRSVLAVPLLVREQVTGCLLMYGRTPRAFSAAETDFGRKLAATVSLALENARLLKAEVAAREAEERRSAQLQVLRTVAQSASSSLDVATAASAVVDEVRRLLDADQVEIRLADRSGRLLEPVATFDPAGQLQQVGPMPVQADRETAMCYRTGEPRVGADAQTEEVAKISREAAVATGIRAFAILPLRTGGSPVGTLFAAWKRVHEVPHDELALLEAIAAAATTGLENARLYETEHDIAKALQEYLIHPMPQVAGLELAAVSRPANRPDLVGGDFHDVLVAREGLVALLIGDVTGKGIAAAGMTETVRSAMRVLALITPSPEYILRHVNDLLLREPGHAQLVTALLVVVDLTRRQAFLSSAGHPPPVLVRGGASAELLELPFHPPLGAFPATFAGRRLPLLAGDRLLLYTDGVTEARRGREMFGERRLLETIDALRDSDVQAVAHGVGAAVERYADGLRDDVQILGVRVGD
jgi:serine phosphatase RsbU (regulator of sigma subunit)/anti-sigma regulatory factor (Ser/Thr protein kinase)